MSETLKLHLTPNSGNEAEALSCFVCGQPPAQPILEGRIAAPEWLAHVRGGGKRTVFGLHEACRASTESIELPSAPQPDAARWAPRVGEVVSFEAKVKSGPRSHEWRTGSIKSIADDRAVVTLGGGIDYEPLLVALRPAPTEFRNGKWVVAKYPELSFIDPPQALVRYNAEDRWWEYATFLCLQPVLGFRCTDYHDAKAKAESAMGVKS